MWLMVFLGCANNIRNLYEQEKAAVLAEPAALGANWEPELRVRLSDPALEVLSKAALSSGLLEADQKIAWQGPMGVEAQLSPHLVVKSLNLKASAACDACLDLTASLSGTGAWKLGSLKGEIPISLDLGGTVSFDVKKGDEAFMVSGRLRDVKQVKLKSDSVGDLDIAKPIQSWAKDLADSVPAFEIGEFGGEGVPLRALRLKTVDGALAVEAVTDVAGGGPLAASSGALSQGWELSISQKTALALMRREAFEAGIIDFDVAVDPRYLEIEGDQFKMGLRLWRLTRSGWWREYEVSGSISVLPRTVRLVPSGAKEGDKSKGAGVADPLALLAEGKILSVVEDGLAQTLPAGSSTDIAGQALSLRAQKVKGSRSALFVSGELSLGAPAPEEDPQEPTKKRGGRKDR